jgi:aryl-alcohol dehydrogenase-like predicted oxidoreductase
LHPPKTEQPQYSMLHREFVETNVLPVTEKNGVGLVVWSPLAQGMLTGKYDAGIPKDSRFAREAWAKERFVNDDNVRKVRALRAVAEDAGISRAQLALAWTLRQPGVSSAIIGATKTAQVEDNIKAADITLSPEVVSRVERILSGDLPEDMDVKGAPEAVTKPRLRTRTVSKKKAAN